jgi:hypothetical protein
MSLQSLKKAVKHESSCLSMSLRPLLISGGSNERQRVMMKRKKRAYNNTH